MYTSKVSEMTIDRASQDEVQRAIIGSYWNPVFLRMARWSCDVFLKDFSPYEVAKAFNQLNGKLLHSLNIFSENRHKAITHFINLLDFSIANCSTVRLIEGVDGEGNRVVQDVDVCLEEDGIITMIDITSDPSLVTEKIKKLQSLNYVENYVSRVVVIQKQYKIGKLICPIIKSLTFETDFDLAEHIMNTMSELPSHAIMDLIEIYSDNLQPVEQPSARKAKSFFKAHRDRMVECATKNGPLIASDFSDLIRSFPDSSSSGYTFPNLDLLGMKRQINFFPSVKPSDTFDPWIRAGNIDNFWCRLISVCGKKGIASSSDAEGWPGYQEGIIMRRVVADEPMDMVEIESPHAFKDYFSDVSPSPTLDWVQCEYDLDHFNHLMKSSGHESMSDKYLHKILEDGVDNDVSGLMQSICRGILNAVSDTKCFNLLEFYQSLAKAAGVSRKKFSRVKKRGSVQKKKVKLSLESVGVMENILLMNNIDYRSELQMGSMVVFGETDVLTQSIVRPMMNNQSILVSVNNPILSWWSTAPFKFISLLALQMETKWSCSSKHDILANKHNVDNLGTLMLLFLSNSSKFSQAADQVRYLVLNSTGMGNSTKKLYEKIEWFKPSTLIQNVFMNRLKKMIFIAEYFKANNSKELLSATTQTFLSEPGMHKTIRSTAWKLCFPHDDSCILDESYLFNSFYLNKCLVINRDNKIMSESQVVTKQLESRLEFIERYKPSQMMSLEMSMTMRGGKYCPNIYLQALGACYSTMLTFGSDRDSWIINDISGLLTWTNVNEILNSRGSVTYNGKSGLVQSVNKKVNQNSKCYLTALHELAVMFEDTRTHAEHDADETQEKTLLLPKHSITSLWMPLFNILERELNVVAKMVHKDQIGVREIAVLNAPGRISCYFLEKIARLIRNNEHRRGDFTNVIESTQKDDICTKMYEDSLLRDLIVYDNADCSSWGPSMMPVSLYITLGTRLRPGFQRQLTRTILSHFSNKVFKFPDVLWRLFRERQMIGDNSIIRCYNLCKNSPPNLADLNLQIIKCPEGMFQGILGCTSSVLAADCLRLSEVVLKRKQRNLVSIKSIVTSDDYARVLEFSDGKLYKSSMQNANLHAALSLDYGISRNMSKSFMSGHYLEFNSIFRCRSGIFKPDVKSRLSYIDYSHDFDMYASTISAFTTCLQFARQEGSLVASNLMLALRQYMNLVQHQNLSLYHDNRERLYSVPLEYGGMIRVNMLKWVGMPVVCALVENYGDNVTQSVSNMIKETNTSDLMISLDPEKELSSLPAITRSKIVSLHQRASRPKRMFSEFLNTCPDDWFKETWFGIRGTYGAALISSYQREQVHSENLPSHLKMTIPNAPYRQPLFWNSETKSKMSRADLHKTIMGWQHSTDLINGVMIFNHKKIEEYFELYKSTFTGMVPSSITWVPSLDKKTVLDLSVADARELGIFRRTYSEGKEKNNSYFLKVLKSAAFKERFEKLCFSKGTFRNSLMTGDDVSNIWLIVCKSHFAQNMRLSWAPSSVLSYFSTYNHSLNQARKTLDNIKPGLKGTVDLTKKVKGAFQNIDLTNLLHESIKYPNSTQVADLWSKLYQMSAMGQYGLTIELSAYRGKSKIKVNNGSLEVFENKTSSPKTTEVTVRRFNSNHYEHFVLLNDFSSPRISDNRFDVYHYKLAVGSAKVTIENKSGMLMIMAGDFIISCLGPLLREDVTIYRLETKLEHLVTEEIVAAAGGKSSSTILVAEKDNILDLADPPDAEVDSEEGLFDLDDDELNLDEDYFATMKENINDEFDDNLSDLESDGSSDSTFSLGSTFRETRSAIRSGRAWANNCVRQVRRGGYRQTSVFEIALPFFLEMREFADSDYPAMEQLIMKAKEHGQEFSEWAIDCICTGLKSSNITRSLLLD